MIYIRVLPLLLIFVCPLYIKGDDEKCKDEESEKSTEKLLTMVSDLTNVVKAQSEMIKEQAEKIQDQDQNIRDLRKSLDKRLRENDLKIEWALTDGTLAPKNTSGIMENLARQETKIEKTMDMLRDVQRYTYKRASCADIDGGDAFGAYRIYPKHGRPFFARCENSTGGGWTVIQKRFDGSVDFFRGWEEYAEGFGDPASEYWLGLRHIHAMTQAQTMELYVGVIDFVGTSSYAKYSLFSVSSEENKFMLSVSGYSGTAGDRLMYDNGQQFSTKDHDNDKSSANCSNRYHGAWWYSGCYHAHLNGLFTKNRVNDHKYMWWGRRIKASVMMIRPSIFRP